ncbi:MAG TPA: hypothetical protein VHO25_17285, partial [Polyangiaceae bacterium]|nr:hypothetical protein [Polyangiaceae bacterium]
PEGERAEMTIASEDPLNSVSDGILEVWCTYYEVNLPDLAGPAILSATLQENGKDVLVQWSEHVHMIGTGQFQLGLDGTLYTWNPDSVVHNNDQTLLRFGEQILVGNPDIGAWSLALFDNFGHFEDDRGNWASNQTLDIETEAEDETGPQVVGVRFMGGALEYVAIGTDEKLNADVAPAAATITVSGITGDPTCLAIAPNRHAFIDTFPDFEVIFPSYTMVTLSSGPLLGDTEPTISYAGTEDDPLQDLVEIALDAFSDLPIEIPEQTVDGYVFGYSTNIWLGGLVNLLDDEDHTPLLSAFALKKLDGTPAAATLTAINGWDGQYLEFEVEGEVDWGLVRLVYTKPATKKLTDIVGREVDSFAVIVYED